MTYFDVVLYVLGGGLAGIVNGLLGIGCGVVIVPLLISMQWGVAPAIATAHVGVFLSSAAATYFNRKHGYSLPKILCISMPAVITSQLATHWAAAVPPQFILLGFSGLMFVDLDIMAAAQRKSDELGGEALPKLLEKNFFSYISIGLVTGIAAAVFGLGGGLIVVPLLLILTDEPPKQAVRVSLGVMTATSLAAIAPHLSTGSINVPVGLLLGISTIFGSLLGASLLPYMPNWVLRKLISVCILAAGIHMFIFGIVW